MSTLASPFHILSVIDWDVDSGRYFERSGKKHGFHRDHVMTVEGRMWMMSGKTERARIEFSVDGKRQTIGWEWRLKDGGLPLCERVATKVSCVDQSTGAASARDPG